MPYKTRVQVKVFFNMIWHMLLLIQYLPNWLYFHISEKTVYVSCVSRSSVELPCNLTSPLADQDDQVRLVLWFKNDSAKPIYTYDTRG